MPCYHPNYMIDSGTINLATGSRMLDFRGPVKSGVQFRDLLVDPQAVIVPCGHCLGCRLDYSRQWTNRLLMELDHHNGKAIFVTLTYAPEHLRLAGMANTGNLEVVDLQLFWKRVRKRYNIRYYATGEYGSKTARPHFHAIIFGIGLNDIDDLVFYKNNKLGHPMYNSKWFTDRWSLGHVVISAVSNKTFGYVARYVLKKVYKSDYEDWKTYELSAKKREFSCMSLKPSIGSYYFVDHPDFDPEYANLSLSDGHDSYTFPVPTKLVDKLAVDDPVLASQLKASRRELAISSRLDVIDQIDIDYCEYLKMMEDSKRFVTKTLVRNLDKEL